MSPKGQEPSPCPFCGARLVWQDKGGTAGHPRFELWKHPFNGCFAEGFAVIPGDVPRWNRRIGR